MSVEPEPSNIPTELKQRDQWLYWNASKDKPRMPLAAPAADHGCSWSDPETWVSFETAAENAAEVEQAGVGFVNAIDNDDYARGLIGSIDIDGVVDEDGRPKDWLPSLKGFFDHDAYVEYSPSGEGLRIPIIGMDTPDWWANSHFTPEEHEGAEVLTNKFATYTGNQLRGAGDEPAEYGDWVDAWLREVYKAINGRNPVADAGADRDDRDGDQASHTSGDEWLTEDAAEDALDHINPDCSYETWRDVGMALANHFGRSSGGRLFEEWSRGGSKWGDKAERQAERIIDDASNYNYDAATLVYHAKNGGWDASEAARQYGSENTAHDDERGGEKAAQATADGGVSTASADSGDSGPLPMSKAAVAARAGEESLQELDDRAMAHWVWQMLKDDENTHIRVMQPQESLWSYQDGVWEANGERELRTAGNMILADRFGKNVLTELIQNAKGDPVKWAEKDEFGTPTGTVAVKNGLLDLEKAHDGAGEDAIRDLRPADKALTRLPVEYDPDAEYQEWAEHVEEWAEDGRADALQEYVGYCLHVGEIPIHRALLLVGTGANGKGTFLSVVRALLGEENTSSIELQTLANERDAVAEFFGSLANIDDDLSARKLGAGLGMFKKLVAGDRVRARRLYEDGFEFQATGKHLYAANEVPNVDVDDEDEAFWRRWLLVEFPNHYPPSERDPALRDHFTEPRRLSGVLNWAIEGWARLLEQGHFTNEHHYAQEKRERWQAWGDSVDEFISEHVDKDADAERLTTGEAHKRYKAWCQEVGKDDVGQQEFTTSLKQEDVGYSTSVRINGKVQRGYKQLGLSKDVPELDDTAGGPDRDKDQEQLTGPRDRAERIVEWVRTAENQELSYKELLSKADQSGMERDEFEHALQKSRENGDVYEHDGETYRPT